MWIARIRGNNHGDFKNMGNSYMWIPRTEGNFNMWIRRTGGILTCGFQEQGEF
jgi:hypothetical protein